MWVNPVCDKACAAAVAQSTVLPHKHTCQDAHSQDASHKRKVPVVPWLWSAVSTLGLSLPKSQAHTVALSLFPQSSAKVTRGRGKETG